MPRNRSLMLATAVLALAVALGGWSCKTGDVTLKAQSATIDTIKLAGVTARLLAGPMDATCPLGIAAMRDTCDRWFLFIVGTAPKDPLCSAPTVGAIADVFRKCGFKRAYPFAYQLYEEKKDGAVGVASAIEAVVKQLTGFGEAVTATAGRS